MLLRVNREILIKPINNVILIVKQPITSIIENKRPKYQLIPCHETHESMDSPRIR